MSEAEYERRKTLTFRQAQGLDPLPRQLDLHELPRAARVELWSVLDEEITKETERCYSLLTGAMLKLAKKCFVEFEHQFSDDFDNKAKFTRMRWRKYFEDDVEYSITLNFIQWIIRAYPGERFAVLFGRVLRKHRCAYRVVNNDTLMPVATVEEAAAIMGALEATDTREMSGPRHHLLDAGKELSQGNFAHSVRESISAVEAVAFISTGEKSFSKAIGKMHERRPMHEAFKTGINRLYDYTSQEPGIRHGKRSDPIPNVSERDAIFMLGVCASFVTFVLAE